MREIKFRGKATLTAERMEELEIPHENKSYRPLCLEEARLLLLASRTWKR
jgi:hypothetical protein